MKKLHAKASQEEEKAVAEKAEEDITGSERVMEMMVIMIMMMQATY